MSFFARAILFLPVVALLIQSARAQTLEWVRSGGGLEDGGGGFATDIAVDVAGSVYTTGTIILDTDFDGDGVADGFDSGFGDIFLAKYSGDGDLLWVITPGGEALDQGRAVAVDATGSVYVAGLIQGDADFDGDGAPDAFISGSDHVFLARYDESGAFHWVRAAGAQDSDAVGYDVAVSRSGAIFVTGSYGGSADFSGDAVPDVSENSFGSGFIARYDDEGNLRWVQSMDGRFADEGHAVGVGDDAIYVTGSFSASTDLNGDGIGDADRLVLAKYDHGGVLQWAVSGTGPAGIDMTGLAVGQSGTIYISGSYVGSIDLNGDGMADGSSPRNSFELLVSKFSTVEITGIEQNSTADIPFDDILGQNYPNPFRPVTRIRFQTRSPGHARLTVFDVLGREVTNLVDAHLDGSVHDVTWDASGMPAGLYVYRITTDSFSATRTMVLLK